MVRHPESAGLAVDESQRRPERSIGYCSAQLIDRLSANQTPTRTVIKKVLGVVSSVVNRRFKNFRAMKRPSRATSSSSSSKSSSVIRSLSSAKMTSMPEKKSCNRIFTIKDCHDEIEAEAGGCKRFGVEMIAVRLKSKARTLSPQSQQGSMNRTSVRPRKLKGSNSSRSSYSMAAASSGVNGGENHYSQSRNVAGSRVSCDEIFKKVTVAARKSRHSSVTTSIPSIGEVMLSSRSSEIGLAFGGQQTTGGGQPSSLLKSNKSSERTSVGESKTDVAEANAIRSSHDLYRRKSISLEQSEQSLASAAVVNLTGPSGTRHEYTPVFEGSSDDSNDKGSMNQLNYSVTSESVSIMTAESDRNNNGDDDVIVGVGNDAQLDVYLAEASNKLKLYYGNNFDKKHHECHDKLKALVDVLNAVLKNLRDLLKVPNLDETVARRFLEAQRELSVVEDVVWKIRDAAERHGYSCGIKESLEDMAITLYILRQMHTRQDVLIQEIIITRRQNMELMRIIESLRAVVRPPPAGANEPDDQVNEEYKVAIEPSEDQLTPEPLPSSPTPPAVDEPTLLPVENREVHIEDQPSRSDKQTRLENVSKKDTSSHWSASCLVRLSCSYSVTLAMMVLMAVLLCVTAILVYWFWCRSAMTFETTRPPFQSSCDREVTSSWKLPFNLNFFGPRLFNSRPPPI